jgi:hypothetical protein
MTTEQHTLNLCATWGVTHWLDYLLLTQENEDLNEDFILQRKACFVEFAYCFLPLIVDCTCVLIIRTFCHFNSII